MGYIVNEDYRRQDVGAEALRAVIDGLFEGGIHRVCAECDPRNERSWRPPEKVGMEREAHLKKNVFFRRDENGAPVRKDTFVYAALSPSDR